MMFAYGVFQRESNDEGNPMKKPITCDVSGC